MPKFIDTRGHSTLGIAICARCKEKFPEDELREDPNYPGLFVCTDDLDQFDPWRLPAKEADRIILDHPRPDADISGNAGTPVFADQINGISLLKPSTVWQPNTNYLIGAQITAQNPDDQNVSLPVPVFLCVIPGVSGPIAPTWPQTAGSEVTDGTITWLCEGFYIM